MDAPGATSTPARATPSEFVMQPPGTFAKCTARYNGATRSTDHLEAFIETVQIYKECSNVSDEHALRGLPMLLTGDAAVWWQGVKSTVARWDAALERLRSMYGTPLPPYKIFREVFSCEQNEVRSDVFISRVRALLAKLPYDVCEEMKIDIVYGLLSRKIRKRLARDDVSTVDVLLTKCRAVEEALHEASDGSIVHSKPVNPSTATRNLNQPTAAAQKHNPYSGGNFFDSYTSKNKVNSIADKPTTDQFIQGVSSANIQPVNSSSNPKGARVRPRCTYCRRFGHSADECRSKERDTSESTPGNSLLRCYGCGKHGVVQSKCETCRPSQSRSGSQTADLRRAESQRAHVTNHSLGADSNTDYRPRADCHFRSVADNSDHRPRATCEFHSADIFGSPSTSDSRPLVEISVSGVQGVAIVDTGATHSIASGMLYDIMRKNGVKFEETFHTVGLADGSQQTKKTLVGATQVNIEDRAFAVSFIVFPESDTRTLLGRDTIVNAGIVPDLARGTWTFSDTPEQVHHFARSYTLTTADNPELLSADAADITLRVDEGTNLTAEQRAQLNSLLMEKADRFATEGPPTDFAVHRIKVADRQEPMASPPYRLSANRKEALEQELQKLLAADIIEECESPWAANVVLVPKHDGNWRLCIDYRKLNAVTEPDRYPLPRIEDVLHAAKTTNFMSTCDLRSGYFQVALASEDQDKTAFVTPLGTYRFKRMPMGLRNSSATFQRLIDRFKSNIPGVAILAYLDDLVVLSGSFECHLKDLQVVFDRLALFNLRINREKSVFARDSIKFLGHIIVPGGIQVDPHKTEAISKMPPPKNIKHLKTFLQTSSWFRRFIPNYADIAKPLTNLLKKESRWVWTTAQQDAFENIKGKLTSAPILRQADENLPFILRTDSSGYCLGAVLMQGEGHDERPLEYASRLLNSAEKNYSTTEREALAVVWAVNKFRGYIDGAEVVVKSDHEPLRWLMSLKSPSGRLARWALTLQEFNIRVEYTPGRCNAVADTLSRPPCEGETNCDLCYAQVDLPTRSPTDVRENQMKDPEVKKIFENLEDDDLFRGRTWADKGYTISDGILYRYNPESDEETACLVVPAHERANVLAEYHDAPTAGHFGVERTLQRIHSKYFWPGMRKHVSDYVRGCVACQRYKADTRKPAGLLQTPATARRFEVVAVDLFGPLPETPAGNKWILIIEDVCSRWTELFPLKVATSADCAKTLIAEVYLRYGVPRRVISDNGVQFISEVMQQTCHVFGISQSLTPLYHPEANPVERKNRDLKPQLAILVGKDHNMWDIHLPAIRFAMNSAVTHSTGYSPAFLTFGRELRAPADVMADMRAIAQSENVVTAISAYLKNLSSALADARDEHEKNQDYQKRYADQHRRPAPNYAVGDLVLLRTQERLNVLYERNWTRLVHEQLRKFESSIVAAARQTAEPQPSELALETKWTFSGAIIYCVTLITTIGYGNVSPKTAAGRAATVAYAAAGVPLTLACLAGLGASLARLARMAWIKATKSNVPNTWRSEGEVSEYKLENHFQLHEQQCLLPQPAEHNQYTSFPPCVQRSPGTVRAKAGDRGQYSQVFQRAPPSPRAATLGRMKSNVLTCDEPHSSGIETQTLDRRRTPGSPKCMATVHGSPRGRGRGTIQRPRGPVIEQLIAEECGDISRNQDDVDDSENADDIICPHDTPSRVPLIWKEENRKTTKTSEAQTSSGTTSVTHHHTNHNIEHCHVPVGIVLFLLLGYICAGAAIFSAWENWSFLDAAYFCFIALATIGFGDFVPTSFLTSKQSTETSRGEYIQMIACCAYLIFGLILIAMSFSLLQDEVVSRCSQLANSLGLSKQ